MNSRLRKNWGKRLKIYLLNGFYYEGELIENDDKFLVLDDRKSGNRIIRVDDIEGLVIYGEERE